MTRDNGRRRYRPRAAEQPLRHLSKLDFSARSRRARPSTDARLFSPLHDLVLRCFFFIVESDCRSKQDTTSATYQKMGPAVDNAHFGIPDIDIAGYGRVATTQLLSTCILPTMSALHFRRRSYKETSAVRRELMLKI